MADYCDKCADKYGFEKETYPLFCEGCGKYFENINIVKIIKNFIKKIVK